MIPRCHPYQDEDPHRLRPKKEKARSRSSKEVASQPTVLTRLSASPVGRRSALQAVVVARSALGLVPVQRLTARTKGLGSE